MEQALESVRGNETIVVDHGSTDGTLELVRERFPEARVVEEENKGFGAGSNAGMRIASGDLFLLLPISVNGIAVRESFFVSFLGNLGVDADKAFATGFLFFVVTLCLSVPGAVILAWQSLRGFTRASPENG